MYITRRENILLLNEKINLKLQVLIMEQLGKRVMCLNAILRSRSKASHKISEF
jgi:hypothetical protein